MAIDRRRFLQCGLGVPAAVVLGGCETPGKQWPEPQGDSAVPPARRGTPVLISTWEHGMAANEAAMRALLASRRALDAVEAGVRVSESDPTVRSVGLGGYPNIEGVVQLDAAIMDGPSARAGAVAALEEIEHPISVARKVMEETRHVLLVGPGAQQFALQHGFPRVNLLTEETRAKWEELKERSAIGHDTIGMCGLDADGNLAVACTTSGLASKLPGRVGDSPLVGSGLFVDNEVGAATATGIGEEVLQTAGSFLVVENMRRGMSPPRACQDAVERILHKHPAAVHGQVAFLALRRDGQVGAYSIQQDFNYAHFDGEQNRLRASDYAVCMA
jgi:isoaspartyl peptidase/L-asparaginase-like protein (Ntn-hydrolase superfamily)